MINRSQLNIEFKWGEKRNPLQLYCMLIGVVEQQGYQFLETIQQTKMPDFEAGRIYQNTDTGELHVIHFPGKNSNDVKFQSTPRLSDVLNDVESGVATFLGKNPQYNQNEIYRHFPVSETRKNLEHYVYVNAANDNPFNVFDSMFKHSSGVFNKKETKKILLKNNEAELTDSDIKYRNWQEPIVNDWQCGYYVAYHLELFLKRLQNKEIETLDPFKGTTFSGNKKKQDVLSHFNGLYQLGASKLKVQKDYSKESDGSSTIDDDWDMNSESENESNSSSDIIYSTEEEVKSILKAYDAKQSFWRRHPVLTAALIGGGIALAGIVAVGIVVATGGAGTPVIGGLIAAAVGLIDATLGVLGVAGTIAAGIGAGVAAIGLTAGIGASVGAVVNKKPASKQSTERKSKNTTTDLLSNNALGQSRKPEVEDARVTPAKASSSEKITSDLDDFIDLGLKEEPGNRPVPGKKSD